MLKQSLKRIAQAVAPRAFEQIQIIRARRHSLRLQEKWGLTRIESAFLKDHDLVVHHGPFKGMKLAGTRTSGSMLPRLIGSYECELHPALAEILNRKYRVVADIGCAEGYFAVGLARRLPDAIVYAFDLDPVARAVCSETSQLNGVSDRVRVMGRCDPQALMKLLKPRSLVFSDCEGYEYILLDPVAVPALRQSDIIVELHDGGEPQRTTALIERFQATHKIQRIEMSSRDPSQYPELKSLSAADAKLAISEIRTPGQAWLYLVANAGDPAA